MVIVVWSVQELWGERYWLTAIITYSPPLLYLGICGLAGVIAALCRDLRAVFWSAAAGGLCLLSVARPSYPLSRPHAPPNKTFRIVTWNIHDQLDSIPQILQQLRRLDPDIVCLQEANARRFRECWPGAKAVQAHSNLILTSGDVLETHEIKTNLRGRQMRPFLAAKIRLNGETIWVLNVHLYSLQPAALIKQQSAARAKALADRTAEMRQLQAAEIVRWTQSRAGAVVIAGDFNTPPRGRLYKSLCRLATNCFAAAGKGFGWTFPADYPLLRIDHVWASRDIKPLRCWRVRTGASDHCPVVADVVLP